MNSVVDQKWWEHDKYYVEINNYDFVKMFNIHFQVTQAVKIYEHVKCSGRAAMEDDEGLVIWGVNKVGSLILGSSQSCGNLLLGPSTWHKFWGKRTLS